MTRQVDKEVLIGFVEEAKSYLPVIRQGLKTYQANPTALDKLEEAHRHAHTIKGASSMVGLTGLSHIAYYVEESLEEIGAGQLSVDDKTVQWFNQALLLIEGYLDGVMNDTLHEATLVAEATRAYRRLRNMPAEEDETAVAEVLTEVIGDSSTPPADVAEEILSVEEAVMVEEEEEAEEYLQFDDDDEDFDMDDISAELMEAFYLEAEEHMQNIGLMLNELGKSPEGKDLLQEVRRSVHTLKGAAGTVGLPTIAELSHRMEDLLDELYEDTVAVNADIMDLLFASADTLEDLTGPDNIETDRVSDALTSLYTRYATLLDEAQIPQPRLIKPETGPLTKEQLVDLAEVVPNLQKAVEREQLEGKFDVPVPAPALVKEKAISPKEKTVRRESSEVVRVSIDRLDELIRLVSEMVITRTAFEQHMSGLVREVDELRTSLERLRRVSTKLEIEYEVSTLGGGSRLALTGQGVPPEQMGLLSPVGNLAYSPTQAQDFDELEFDRYTEFHLLSRELSETTSDVSTIGNALNTLIGDFDSILNRQGYLSSDLQEKLMRTRMVPLATLATRLHRAVRVVAKKQDKQVELILDGEEIELDKTVLEELSDPLLHILRNGVDHGIEPPALRQVTGKAERGQIRLNAYHEGNQIVIKVSDDGAGMASDVLRAKAVNSGYVSEADASQLSDDALRSLVFLPGFSTAGQITDVSGRGVGLDVVKTNINKLKGTVVLESIPGQGTTFTIRLPMTLAVTRALLVKAHSETFAVPLNAVDQILRLEREDIERIGHESVVRIGGQVYPMLRLGEVLKLRRPPDDTVQRLPVLILNAGGQQVALIVDHIVQGREIVIKTLGNHLRRIHGIMGATLMGDGSVVLILNPVELVTEPVVAETSAWTPAYAPTAHHKTWKIMIVDDSVSVRRVISNLIKNVGWQPVTAKDGLEALEIIQRSAQKPDLILLDIEMPRMDGYELAATLQGQDTYRSIPIVMLTSRAGEKHRRKAFDLGVSEYVVKPYQDETLLSIIRRLTQGSNSNGAKPT